MKYLILNFDKLVAFFGKKRNLFGLLVLIALAVSLQVLLSGTRQIDGGTYTHYNNYLIFKGSFNHLIQDKDLYLYYPLEHFDLFKYSATFALLFAPFALLPDFLGLPLWNIFNLSILLLALLSIPKMNTKLVFMIIVLSILELITTTQNVQCNTLMVALFLFTFSSLERKNYILATLFVVLAIYIKLYGIVAFSLFLFYPEKWKSILYSAMWMTLLFFLPLIVIDFEQLIFNYKSWGRLLSIEQDQIYGISVMGWLHSWFNLSIHKFIPVIIGVVLFCIPLLKFKSYKVYNYRFLGLCSVLIWVVIFNHRAESASYIIAYMGIALWFVFGAKSKWRILLMASAFILITLSPTDMFPRYLREHFVQGYTLKAVPAIIVWLNIIWDMWFVDKFRMNQDIQA